MIIPTTEKHSVTAVLFVGSLLFLTGCWPSGKEKTTEKDTQATSAQSIDTSAVSGRGELLLSIDGKPVLYAQDFEDQKAMAIQSDQRTSMILQLMEDAEYKILFKSMEAGQIMKEWVIRHGIDSRPDLEKTRRQFHEALDMQLYIQYYQLEHPINVTKEEALEFYNAQRSKIQGLLISPAGVDILYIKFDKRSEAEMFSSKIKDGAKKIFESIAKEDRLTPVAMVVSEEGYADESLRHAALSAKKYPSKEVIKMEDGSYWVVAILGKKEAKYHSFDLPEVQEYITRMCLEQKRELAQLAEVEKLSQEYNVVENKAFFENKKENIQKGLQHAQRLVQAAQQQDDVEYEDEEIEIDDKI